MYNILEGLERWIRQSKRSRILRKIALVMACMVIFTTTYALILPAITIDDEKAYDMPGLYLDDTGLAFVVDSPELKNEPGAAEELVLEEEFSAGEESGYFLEEETDESEAESETEAEVETEAETEPVPEMEGETESETEAEIEPELETESEAETEPESEVEPKTEPKLEVETEAETEPEPEVEAETEAESETEPVEEREIIKAAEETEREQSLETTVLKAVEKDIDIRLIFAEGIELPEGAVLSVREITQADPEYNEYVKAVYKATNREEKEIVPSEDENIIELDAECGEITFSASGTGEPGKIPVSTFRFYEISIMLPDGTSLPASEAVMEFVLKDQKLYLKGYPEKNTLETEQDLKNAAGKEAAEQEEALYPETSLVDSKNLHIYRYTAPEYTGVYELTPEKEIRFYAEETQNDVAEKEKKLHVRFVTRNLNKRSILGVEYLQDPELVSQNEDVKSATDTGDTGLMPQTEAADFKYEEDGKVYFTQMTGAEDILLSALLEKLGVKCATKTGFANRTENGFAVLQNVTPAFIQSISSTDDQVISITPTGEDYIIRILKSTQQQEAIHLMLQDGTTRTINVKADGITELTAGDVTIRTISDLYLPQNASAYARVIDEEQSDAIALLLAAEKNGNIQAASHTPASAESTQDHAVAIGEEILLDEEQFSLEEEIFLGEEEGYVGNVMMYDGTAISSGGDSLERMNRGPARKTAYMIFDIGLEHVEENVYSEGFQVTLKLPEKIIGKDLKLYHIHDGQVEELLIEKEAEIRADGTEQVSSVCFMTHSFSEFVLQYTVDFHWEVDGKMYEFSLPGGGFISFSDLIEALGVAKTGENGDTYLPGEVPGINNQDENGENQGENGAENAENTGNLDTHNPMEVSGIDNQDATALTLDGVVVSEATREFVADVESVVFSNPALVDVSKVENETTVEGIKESRGLEVQYSADLTEEQIAEINAQTVEAGDWALISVQPFESMESLTVTMKTGEIFEIRVTDYQISTNVLTADGQTYKITVTYDDDAEIPEGTKLVASEIEPDTDEYIQHLGQAWAEINKEYLEQQEQINNGNFNTFEDIRPVNLDDARFFNISLISRDEEIEPKAPVKVDIQFVDGLETNVSESNQIVGIAHYKSEEVELIEEVDATRNQEGEIVELIYTQESFSAVGAYVGQKTYKADIGLSGAAYMPRLMSSIGGGGLNTTNFSTKTLIPNKTNGVNDGTYTLSLNVTGSQQRSEATDITKANVLVVMDRSSSMRYTGGYAAYNGSYDSGTTYYGRNAEGSYYALFYYNGTLYSVQKQNYNWDGSSYYTYSEPYEGQVYVESSDTRLSGEQEALRVLFQSLLDKNDPSTYGEGYTAEAGTGYLLDENGERVLDSKGQPIRITDVMEISLISFGTQANSSRTDTEVDWTTNYTALENGVNSTFMNRGTNWEDALIYAKTKADAIKATQSDEEVYILFLTDGAPTAVQGEGPYYVSGTEYGARHYDKIVDGTTKYVYNDGTGNYNNGSERYDHRYGGNEWALTEVDYAWRVHPGTAEVSAKTNALNAAKALVDSDYNFYSVFTYGTDDSEKRQMRRLVNYAYTGEYTDDASTDAVGKYYSTAQSASDLTNIFNSIFSDIIETQGLGNISVTDGVTNDVTATALVSGSVSGFKYTVSGLNGYTVTAVDKEGGGAVVTFTINGHEYTTDEIKYADVTKNVDDGNGNITKVTTQEPYYSVVVGDTEYKMTLAGLDANNRVNWDLAALGILPDGITYTCSFIVWPQQEAYDYVAGLNNHLTGYEWKDELADPETYTDGQGRTYRRGGVAGHPTIVKYVEGDSAWYSVLTNTDQSATYTIIKTETTTTGDTTVTNTSYDGPYTQDLPYPDPMPLTATASQIEKVWNIDRDPDILAQLLYGDPNNHYSIGFNILQDGGTTPYTSVGLGWDEEEQKYIWNSDDIIYVKWDEEENKYVRCEQGDDGAKGIGTHWAESFSIATGLMLSEARMTALGLDKTAYPWTTYPAEGGTKYYLLEEGHDYTIQEPNVGYEFDFEAPVYHPMLVDGTLMDVDFENIARDGNGNVTSFSMTGINPIEVAADGRSALTVENTLRGYIILRKEVVDSEGNAISSDETEFTYEVTLDNDEAPFVGDHIPWYGISGLYYHDDDGNYYQAEIKQGQLQISTEAGGPYSAECTSGTFDSSNTTGQTLKFTENGVEKSVTIYGNQMKASNEGKKVEATLYITQNQTLSIANVPAGSTYTITELSKPGYQLIKINGVNVSGGQTEITGEIVPNDENDVVFTNQCLVIDINLQKIDSDGHGLEGAVFQIKSVNGKELTLATELDGVDIGGLGTVKKIVNGETKTFESAFETTGSLQTITGLPDGTYRLYEVYVPAGYISTLPYIEFNITDRVMTMVTTDESLIFIAATNGDNPTLSLLKIKNTPGAALPNTGGPGTRLFTILGSILVMFAAAMLWGRRRYI